MRIVINPLDKNSVANAIKIVNRYKKDFEEKEKEFTRRLAEIGVTVANTAYSVADSEGEHQISVYLQETSNGYSVFADGYTIGFLEFGTGVKNQEWVDNNNVSKKPYTPPPHGSFGKGHGKQLYGWWFKSEEYGVTMHTYGNPPAEGMLTARNEMVQRVTQIAREVWQ